MNRRDLMKAIAACVPGAAIRVEPRPTATDLIVIEYPGCLAEDEVINLRRAIEGGLMSPNDVRAREDLPRVLVLDRGATLRIERGVATVELSS